MLIYNYHPQTGEFLGEANADESPREPGVFLIPAHSTQLKPKAARDSYTVVFRNGKWGYVRTVSDADPTDEPVLTEAHYVAAIQAAMDAKARERRYDSIASAISYRGDPNPQFSAEADALFAWRSAVWTMAYAELARVTNGLRAPPTLEALVEEIPPFVWP
jgi:hypothetical protein